ncbi:hypothetical protein V1477_008640 [Vespula maculifrons]|uniref:Uncharacterized protein n=1 Tax=Vespula maculifrons TaxID=7453 RepID=A0ABD2CDM1_VESMC
MTNDSSKKDLSVLKIIGLSCGVTVSLLIDELDALDTVFNGPLMDLVNRCCIFKFSYLVVDPGIYESIEIIKSTYCIIYTSGRNRHLNSTILLIEDRGNVKSVFPFPSAILLTSTYIFLQRFVLIEFKKLGATRNRRLVRSVRYFPDIEYHLRGRSKTKTK